MELSRVIDVPHLAGLRERHGHQLALVAYAGLAGFGLHVSETSDWKLCLLLIAAIGMLACASSYRRARTIADIATSRIGSAAQGYVEVVGQAKADPGELIFSPYSHIPCIWYRYRVFSRDDSRSNGGRSTAGPATPASRFPMAAGPAGSTPSTQK